MGFFCFDNEEDIDTSLEVYGYMLPLGFVHKLVKIIPFISDFVSQHLQLGLWYNHASYRPLVELFQFIPISLDYFGSLTLI